MTAENQEAATGGGGNATRSRSRSQRSRQLPSSNPRPPAAVAATQQPPTANATATEEEEKGPLSFFPILNWIIFFFAMQKFAIYATHIIMPANENTIANGNGNGNGNVAGSVSGNDMNDIIANPNKMKPRGANVNSKGKMHINDAIKNGHFARRDGKPSPLWDLGTVMDLDVIFSDSPYVPNGWPSLTTAGTAADSTSTNNQDGTTDAQQQQLHQSGEKVVNPRRTKVKLNNNNNNNNNNNDDVASKNNPTILATWRQEGLILGGIPSSTTSQQHPQSSVSILSTLMPSGANQEMNHRNTTLTIPLTEAIWNNETHVYAYIRLQRRRRFNDAGGSKNGNADNHNNYYGESSNSRMVRKDDVLVKRMVLTRYRKRKKMRDEKSLLDTPSKTNNSTSSSTISSSTTDTIADTSVLTKASLNKTHDQILLYMKPSLTLQLVEMGPIDFPSKNTIPKQFSDHMDWYEGEDNEISSRSGTSVSGEKYYPILYGSEFWTTYSSLKEVNGTLKESKVDVTFEPVSMWKWQLQSQMEDSWKTQEAFTGEEDQSNDILRTMLLDTNPYLLAVTGIVSMLHTLFDILAFKNDISFYKNKKSMEGISLRSMIVNVFFSVVILLYLADNDTNFMVLMSNGVGLLIDMWKISKAITIKFEGGKVEWVEAQSYKKSRTKEYDEIATSHLLFVTMPLVAGYGMYSLLFQKHRGWYSWILNTLVGFIYMFGFVMMTPQLFINYKLQSVAHLNWRTMTYKSINTFIDDLFAFVIKMPIMHRLACLRDDVIFFIYCYQRYKYQTDYTRVNEFGQCAQPTEEMLAEIESVKGDEIDETIDNNNATARRRRTARDKRE